MTLLCKKILINSPITPGKYYTVDKMNESIYRIFYDMCVSDTQGNNWYFSDRPNSFVYIWDYFYTPQETRKMKLQKLNEITL